MTNENIICVWLDNRLIRSEDYLETQNELRATVTRFETFKNSDECLDFITDTTDARIFLITTTIIAKNLLHLIHSIEQIDSIYLFYSNKSAIDQQWVLEFHKVKGIFNDMKLIYNRFLKDTTVKDDQQIAISFLSSNDINSRDINRHDPSFMYFQLIKEILLNDCLLESEEQTKIEMIDYCRKVCVHNPTAIVLLDEFEQTFIPEMSIYWYTRESFLYKMLNKALWTPEPDVLYKLRYFLRHLSRQILSEAEKQRDQLSSMVVYRGQSMSISQIEKLKRNLGGFLSFNNFLSTSLKRNVALNFLLGSEIGVLFEIEVDLKMQKFPVVNIELIDHLKNDENEQELLFTMGSVFRILQIDKQPTFYRVQLALSDDIDQKLTIYKEKLREPTRTNHSFLSLLRLMDELSEFRYVDRFAEMLKEDLSLQLNFSLIALIHHTFGSIYLSRGQCDKALFHLNSSLNIYLSYLPADDTTLTPTYNNIGSVYLTQGDYDKALQYQQLALDCQLKSKNPKVSSIVTYTNNLAKIYDHQGKYDQAIEHFQKSIELQKNYFDKNDSSLIETYSLISSVYFKKDDYGQGIFYRQKAVELQEKSNEEDPESSADFSIKTGLICMSQGQYEEALIYFHSALEIQQKYFLPDNPTLATTLNHIAQAYFKSENYEQALNFYKKALEIEEKSLAFDHPSISTSYFNISTAYVGLSSWFEALEYCQKSVEKLKQTSHPNPSNLASFIYYIGYIFHQQQEYQHALIHYEESIQIYENSAIDDDVTVAAVYHRTGQVYYQLKRFDDALKSYQKTLQIELKHLPDNAQTIATTYSDISSTYSALKQFDQAISAGEQAIQQLLKTLPNNHFQVFQQQIKLSLIKQQMSGDNSVLQNLFFN